MAISFSRGSSQPRDWTHVSCRFSTTEPLGSPESNYARCCAKLLQSCPPHGLQPTRLLCPCDSPGKNTGVGCRALLQGVFPTQDWTRASYASCIDRRFFTTNATWEALKQLYSNKKKIKVKLNKDISGSGQRLSTKAVQYVFPSWPLEFFR